MFAFMPVSMHALLFCLEAFTVGISGGEGNTAIGSLLLRLYLPSHSALYYASTCAGTNLDYHFVSQCINGDGENFVRNHFTHNFFGF
jgi:hypothetical protein